MFDSLLEALGLKETYAQRYARTVASLHPELVNALHAMGLRSTDEEHRPMFGWYAPGLDTLALNAHSITQARACINNTLAHELIHATGHHERLNRGHVGVQSRHFAECNPYDWFATEAPAPTPEQEDSEEAIAQYGGMLLLQRLGIESPGIEQDTARYLKRHNRPNGLTLEERAQATLAVTYVLSKLKREATDAA